MKRFLVLVALVATASTAEARNTEHYYPVGDAIRDGQGVQNLQEDIPFFFAGAKHPAIKKSLGEWSTRKSTRGVFRSDEASCHVALLSALIQLQERTRSVGGDAVVDIVSITRGVETSSATQYRCVAGATVVHVGLKGRVVKLK